MIVMNWLPHICLGEMMPSGRGVMFGIARLKSFTAHIPEQHLQATLDILLTCDIEPKL